MAITSGDGYSLNRGELSEGDVIHVTFTDGDKTICQVIGENSDNTGVRCRIVKILSRGRTQYAVGEKRTFKYGRNTSRYIQAEVEDKCEETRDCEECEIVETNLFNLTTDKPMLQELTQTLKRLLSPELQAMYKAGFISKDLELTIRGTKELVEILFSKFQTELATRASEVVAELEKENK